jgi:hypothetical protein
MRKSQQLEEQKKENPGKILNEFEAIERIHRASQ